MKSKYITIFSIALIVILIDQITKLLIKTNFQLNQSIPLVKDVFHLRYIRNFGAGFGIMQQQTWILIFISITVIGVILYYLDRIKDDFRIWPVFNFADGFVTIGIIGLVVYLWRK